MSRRRSIRQLASIFLGRLPKKPDWVGIVEIANQELITAELYDRLRQLGAADAIPADLRSFLDEVESRVTDRMLQLSDTLCEAVSALDRKAITPMLLKGSSLLAEFDLRKPDLAKRRIVSDLDLLVKPADFSAAVEALRKAGFVVSDDSQDITAYDVVVLTRPTDAGAIDLHQGAPGPHGIIDVNELYARSRLIAFRDIPVRVATAEDQILMLVLHDQLQDGHFWRGGFNFRHLVDIARLTAGPSHVDWAYLSARRHSSTLRIAVAAQLAAARNLVGAKIPTDFPGSGWGRLHYWRQRAQFTWPLFNLALNKAGISKNVWQHLSARSVNSR